MNGNMNGVVDKMIANYLTVLENPNARVNYPGSIRNLESAIGIYCETTVGVYVNDELISNYMRILANPEIRQFVADKNVVAMQSCIDKYIETTSKNYVDAYHAQKGNPFLDAFETTKQTLM